MDMHLHDLYNNFRKYNLEAFVKISKSSWSGS